jgi:Hypervirulence associated proteins TUDOR domain
MAKTPSVGDTVTWNTSQGETTGTVVEKKTKDFQFDGQHFTASADEPAFVVESEKSGKRAAHKGSALTVK